MLDQFFMRNIVLSLLFIISATTIVSGQITGLFVDDNSIDAESSETIYTLLRQNLDELDYFHAVDSMRSPTYNELKDHNLVIWYCGSDTDELLFWEGNQDNQHLEEFISNGGNFWIIGSGFLNARYIKPPRNFSTGSILFDYLGISKWTVETYTDDGGFGVPELAIAAGTPVNTLTLDVVTWEDPPEPFVDGYELVDGSYKTYICTPSSYSLYGECVASYYPGNKFENMTFAFDPANMDSNGDINNLLNDILSYYKETLSATDENYINSYHIELYPNPVQNVLNIRIDIKEEFNIQLFDAIGNLVVDKKVFPSDLVDKTITLEVDGLKTGYYLLKVDGKVAKFRKSVVVFN